MKRNGRRRSRVARARKRHGSESVLSSPWLITPNAAVSTPATDTDGRVAGGHANAFERDRFNGDAAVLACHLPVALRLLGDRCETLSMRMSSRTSLTHRCAARTATRRASASSAARPWGSHSARTLPQRAAGPWRRSSSTRRLTEFHSRRQKHLATFGQTGRQLRKVWLSIGSRRRWCQAAYDAGCVDANAASRAPEDHQERQHKAPRRAALMAPVQGHS